MILTGLDLNVQGNKEYYNQPEKYDEWKSLKKFMEKHNKGNIIQKLFLILNEYKIFCKKCGMNTFQFNYAKYIYIKDAQKDLIYQKIFEAQKGPISKGKTCVFCNGQETDYSIEKKALDCPQHLIVIIDQTQINNFPFGLNLGVTNDAKTTYYNLNYFI